MLLARAPDEVFDIELAAHSGIKLQDALLDLRPKFRKRRNTNEQLTPKLLLRRFRQCGRLRHRQFKCLGHGRHPSRWTDAWAAVTFPATAPFGPPPTARELSSR